MREKPPPLSLRLMIKAEILIMTRLVPTTGPGPLFKWLFKMPVFLNKIGLGWLNSSYFLILTTTGRKTGVLHQTPLEYRYEPESDTYIIMAGWGGRTDWYRNTIAHPYVHVKLKGRQFAAQAKPLLPEEVATLMGDVIRINPDSLKILSRWAGTQLDGSYHSLLPAAKHFPSLRLIPVEEGKTK